MSFFDNNIHMNGAGMSYQAFLDLAAAAEAKGGKIGDRTVRLVKAGDGLATTTSRGLKGDRRDQIGRLLYNCVIFGKRILVVTPDDPEAPEEIRENVKASW